MNTPAVAGSQQHNRIPIQQSDDCATVLATTVKILLIVHLQEKIPQLTTARAGWDVGIHVDQGSNVEQTLFQLATGMAAAFLPAMVRGEVQERERKIREVAEQIGRDQVRDLQYPLRESQCHLDNGTANWLNENGLSPRESAAIFSAFTASYPGLPAAMAESRDFIREHFDISKA
jgi:hypothetical protein